MKSCISFLGLATLWAGLSAAIPEAAAQKTPLESRETAIHYNVHSGKGVPLSPTAADQAAAGRTTTPPTEGQFKNATVFGAGPVTGTPIAVGMNLGSLNLGARAEALNWPRGKAAGATAVVLLRAQVGGNWHAQKADFYFGSIIPVPLGRPDGTSIDQSITNVVQRAKFRNPGQLAFDQAGNLFVTDTGLNTIRKITPWGQVSTLAGKAFEFGSADGAGAEARFDRPNGIAIDDQNNVYVTEEGHHWIRKITPDGVVSVFAGRRDESGFVDGPDSVARFNSPDGLLFEKHTGRIYVADRDNGRVRKLQKKSDGRIHAESPYPRFSDEGATVYPRSLAYFQGDVYVTADSDRANKFIFRVNTTFENFEIRTSATVKNGRANWRGIVAGRVPGIGTPFQIVTEGSTIVRLIEGRYEVIAGQHDSTEFYKDGAALGEARFGLALGLAFDNSDNLFIADSASYTIRKMNPWAAPPVVTTFAGVGRDYGGDDSVVTVFPATRPEDYWLPRPQVDGSIDAAPFYYSPHARTVFATRPGAVGVTWRAAVPTSTRPADYGTNPERYFVENGNYYSLVKTNYIVSGAAVKRPRKIYWTEGAFRSTGKPVVVPSARVAAVVSAYSDVFPERVAAEYVAPGQSRPVLTNAFQELRTFWYDSQQSQLLAYNLEGRVFAELLGNNKPDGTRQHLGFEIVDVVQQPLPIDQTVDLGDVVLAPVPAGESEADLFPDPLLSVDPSFLYQQPVPGRERPNLYAARETVNQNDVLIHWLESGLEAVRWPLLYGRYKQKWPVSVARYSHYARPVTASDDEARETAVQLPIANVPFIQWQDPLDRPRAKLTEDQKLFTQLDAGTPAHRTLLRYASGDLVAFQHVYSWLHTALIDQGVLTNTFATNLTAYVPPNGPVAGYFDFSNILVAPRVVNETAFVGTRLAAPVGERGAAVTQPYLAGHIRANRGNSYSVTAYADPFVAGFEAASRSAIIPVNAIPGKNTMEVWWFRPSQLNAAQGFGVSYWPSAIGRYTLAYPTHGREIILASDVGTGPLESLAAKGVLYVQNDPTKDGYNPNEEHALIIGGQPSAQVFALRDDLNLTTVSNFSSQPFVLLEYTNFDSRPDMVVWKVLREKPEEGILFDRIEVAGGDFNRSGAGRAMQAPMPLPLLPLPVEGSGAGRILYNTESPVNSGDLPAGWNAGTHGSGPLGHYARFTWRDRKDNFWVYRGLHGGVPALAAGSYDPAARSFGPLPAATAQVRTNFSYTVHASRPADGLTLTTLPTTPLPPGLSINGLTITGIPTAPTNVTLQLVTAGTGDGSAVTNSLVLKVVSNTNDVIVAQEALRITNFNKFAATNALYVGRPPFLADSPDTSNSFTMRFYYKTQEGFAWPGINIPPTNGSIVPYMRPKDAQGNFVGDPASKNTAAMDVVYRPVWAPNPPKMKFGQTLTLPTAGLPAIRGQLALQLLYEQSIGTNIVTSNRTVILHDPTREKVRDLGLHGLDKLPTSIRQSTVSGKTYFPSLPPHLATRVFFDPDRTKKGAVVLRGEFKNEPVGEKYIQLNVLRGSDLTDVQNLVPAADTTSKSKWDALVAALGTTMQTFYEDPAVPNRYVANTNLDQVVGVGAVAEVTDDDVAVDSYALSASGPGSGYVTFIANNSEGRRLNAPGDPVTLYVLRVEGKLHLGEIKVLPSANPLSELLTLQHSPDLAGKFAEYEYEWKMAPPVDGVPPVRIPDDYQPLANGLDVPRYTLGGQAGIQVLVDNYVILRYRPKNPEHPLFDQWSAWTTPQLAEGWIKRVLAGINPFNQRTTDLFNNSINTDTSILVQAGKRWEGDIALNLENINQFGLIEIYETVLNRGRGLSIDAGINFGPANDALLLAAGYLNDLYMMVGNEAYADALNPTIGIGTKDTTYGEIATSLFAFRGQVPTVLEEELGLLRGRDDFLQPGVVSAPVYNRMFWNFTRGINAGEVIYSLNYNILDQNLDGKVSAEDAAILFPQGHGDAYGHFLTAVKGYYKLLTDKDFTWVPRTEAVLILGKPVQVDYLDERKFAAGAGAVARTGRQIFDLTWRKDYAAGQNLGWDHFQTNRANANRSINSGGSTVRPTRYWGMDHWASRTVQGAYMNWMVGNAILPAVDPDPKHEGIQRIDRTTVPELAELATVGEAVQNDLDNAEARMTPLGLPPGSLAFDIDPNIVVGTGSKPHFEQIFGRATAALNNAVTAFDDAQGVTRLMRSEGDGANEFKNQVEAQELSFTNALIEIYGTPYPDDIGAGKTFAQGYEGPDLIHYAYADLPESTFNGKWNGRETNSFRIDIQTLPEDWATSLYSGINFVKSWFDSGYTEANHFVEFTVGPHGFLDKPDDWQGRRKAPGKLQQAISGMIAAHNRVKTALDGAEGAKQDLDKAIEVFRARRIAASSIGALEGRIGDLELQVNEIQSSYEKSAKVLEAVRAGLDAIKDTIVEGAPRNAIFGLANGGDIVSAVRAIAVIVHRVATVGIIIGDTVKFNQAQNNILSQQRNIVATGKEISGLALDIEFKEAVAALGQEMLGLADHFYTINEALRALDDAERNYRSLVAKGNQLQQEREVFRKRAAPVVQGFRVRDAAFRLFRNEKLERYLTLFDLASSYAYLAANAYDYETGLLGTAAGQGFLNRIINSRALGIVQDGRPQFAGSNAGDPGLSSALAEMKADWDVLRGRLGFNNPDGYGTVASLRVGNYRVLPGTPGEKNWQDVLNMNRKADLLQDPDIRRHCLQIDGGSGLPVPGIVLEFSTTVADGLNLFGKPLAAGDPAFHPSLFATKLFAVGVVLEGYKGMSDPAANTGAVNTGGGVSPTDPSVSFLDPLALASTPYVYLVPVGVDSMRSPPLGDAGGIRSWQVEDVTIPLPFNIGASGFSTQPFYQSAASLSEPLFGLRRHQAFRPVSALNVFGGNVYGSNGQLQFSQFTNRRLVGRSVWNSKWKLVIPGNSLLSDPNEGLDRFVQTVKDVKLYLVTYSYSGN